MLLGAALGVGAGGVGRGLQGFGAGAGMTTGADKTLADASQADIAAMANLGMKPTFSQNMSNLGTGITEAIKDPSAFGSHLMAMNRGGSQLAQVAAMQGMMGNMPQQEQPAQLPAVPLRPGQPPQFNQDELMRLQMMQQRQRRPISLL